MLAVEEVVELELVVVVDEVVVSPGYVEEVVLKVEVVDAVELVVLKVLVVEAVELVVLELLVVEV